jgi:translocation and assembly module TamB
VRGAAERGQRRVNLQAAGRLGATLGSGATAWRGELASLAVRVEDPSVTREPWSLQLQRPVDWHASAGNFDLSAGEALLRAPAMRSGAPATEAVLAWSPVRRQGGQLSTSGRLSGLPIAWIELVGGPQLAGSALSGDMVFDVQWNAQLGSTLRVDASLARVRGDVNVLAETIDGAAGPRERRRARGAPHGEQPRRAARAGAAVGQRARRARGRRAPHAPGAHRRRRLDLAGTGAALRPAAGAPASHRRVVGAGPSGWRLRGSLGADIVIAGTRAQPELSGTAAGRRPGPALGGRRHRAAQWPPAGAAGGPAPGRQRIPAARQHGRGGDGGTLLAYGDGHWTPQGRSSRRMCSCRSCAPASAPIASSRFPARCRQAPTAAAPS